MTQASLGFSNAAPPVPADRRAALALSLAGGVGPVRHRQWSAADGGASQALARRVASDVRARAYAAADAALEATASCGASLFLIGEVEYPAVLLDLSDPPPAVWVTGRRELLDRPDACAIVGTRDATAYGARAAQSLATALSDAGVVVVSGMARGIDAVAHVAALDGAGGTIAVLGTGVDVVYPRDHRALHRRLHQDGLLLSELPPGSPPTPGAFPRRNRLIAALSRATIVVEAGLKSGALITASAALELGRDVGAVPGPIDVAQAVGSNGLLRDGAAVIAESSDALALLGLVAPRVAPRESRSAPSGFGVDEGAIWTALATPAADMDALCQRTSLPARRCVAALGALEAAGHVRLTFDGSVSRV